MATEAQLKDPALLAEARELGLIPPGAGTLNEAGVPIGLNAISSAIDKVLKKRQTRLESKTKLLNRLQSPGRAQTLLDTRRSSNNLLGSN